MSFDVKTLFLIFKERYASNIRFWIILFFILRLYGITDPPLEIAHNWRQVTGDMVARNMYELGDSILYPRLDFGGEKTGITGTEFSVLNYMMYLLSLLFGFHDWFGRIINLVVSSFGVFYFYKLLKLKFEEKYAFYAAFLLLTSMWLMFSRKVMPDTFSLSLVIIALYNAFLYLQSKRTFALFLYFIFVCLGVLSKIPSAYLLVVLVFPLLDKSIPRAPKVLIVLASVVMLVPVVWWYFSWVPYLVEHFGFAHYYMGTGMLNGFHEIAQNISPTMEKFYFEALKFSGFVVFLAGLFLAMLHKEKRILWIGLLCSLTFGVFMLKAGRNFYHHSYYIVPFVPIMCLFAAYGISQIKKKGLQTLILFLITAESIGNQQHDFILKPTEVYKLSLEKIAKASVSPKALIAINGDDNPQLIYFTHCKGWTITSQNAQDSLFMSDLKGKGCRYLFLDKQKLGNAVLHLTESDSLIFEDQHFVVYSLK